MRSIITFALLLLTGCNNSSTSPLLPALLTCEFVVNPTVVDRPNPRLAWTNQTTGDFRGQKQTACQIRLASNENLLEHPDLWDSGKVNSSQSNQIVYHGQSLINGNLHQWLKSPLLHKS